MKKTLTQKQIADYEQLCRDRNNGRLLTPDGLRFIWVMTVELKEVECVEGKKPEPIGYVFARIADTVFYNAVRAAGAFMSLEDYIDRL